MIYTSVIFLCEKNCIFSIYMHIRNYFSFLDMHHYHIGALFIFNFILMLLLWLLSYIDFKLVVYSDFLFITIRYILK